MTPAPRTPDLQKCTYVGYRTDKSAFALVAFAPAQMPHHRADLITVTRSLVAHDREALPKQQTQDQGRRCGSCGASPRLAQKFLRPNDGRTVRIYECQCGERIWDD